MQMHTPNHLPQSPIAGEYQPLSDIDRLYTEFKNITDNTIRVGGEPFTVSNPDDAPMQQVPIAAEHEIYMNVHPQAIILKQATAARLEQLMTEWFSHYPIEPSYARTHYDQPMLFTRFDGTIDPNGTIGVCEFDDVPTGFHALSLVNPTAASWAFETSKRIDGELHSAFLGEKGYVYPHDDHIWLPQTNGHPQPDITVIPRARRVAPGFKAFMDKWGGQSVVGAWERDNKGPLIGMRLGSLAANPQVAIQFGENIKDKQPVFIKALLSSRTEAAGVMASGKWKIHGASTPNQMRNKFERAGISPDIDYPMVIQPFHRPPTMEDVGLRFRDRDKYDMASFDKSRNATAAELMVPGNEHKFHVLSRVYGVYLPNEGHKIIGGFWMARPNAAVIHGASDTVTGPLYIEGLKTKDALHA